MDKLISTVLMALRVFIEQDVHFSSLGRFHAQLNYSVKIKKAIELPIALLNAKGSYFAKATDLVSLITVTLI